VPSPLVSTGNPHLRATVGENSGLKSLALNNLHFISISLEDQLEDQHEDQLENQLEFEANSTIELASRP